MITGDGILFIEPSSEVSLEPLIDEITLKMVDAWRGRRTAPPGEWWRGVHTCACGVRSDNKPHFVGENKDILTNSLCVHYIAFHRDEVPPEEIEKVARLEVVGDDPTDEELHWPPERIR
jgi:hypothetical protein